MLCCAALCRVVLCCVVLCCVILCIVVLRCFVPLCRVMMIIKQTSRTDRTINLRHKIQNLHCNSSVHNSSHYIIKISPIKTSPVLISIIADLARASGKGKKSSRSNRPGLRKAGSIASGRLVAPITTTCTHVRGRGIEGVCARSCG